MVCMGICNVYVVACIQAADGMSCYTPTAGARTGLEMQIVDFSTMESVFRCGHLPLAFPKMFPANARIATSVCGVGYCGVNSSPTQPWLPFSAGDIWHGCLLPKSMELGDGLFRAPSLTGNKALKVALDKCYVPKDDHFCEMVLTEGGGKKRRRFRRCFSRFFV